MTEKNYTYEKKYTRGAVLIMALMITSGILILGSELVLFVLNSLQYGRSVDYSLVAQYAAESGVEDTLWQIRKEERDTERGNVSLDANEQGYGWSFLDATGAVDSLKFSREVERIEKMFLPENASVQARLYTESGGTIFGILSLQALKISWERESCAPTDQRPWIETSIVQWESGNSINWEDNAQVKKDFQQPLDANTRSVVVNLASYDSAGKPMIIRVKTMFCDLSRFALTLHSDTSATSDLIPIPNYIIANPTGSYRRFEQSSRVIFPAQSALSNMFDFVLFSEEPAQK
ncbi:hypothetical protein HYW94_04250 [Candidatus Uhrbacteria bacterium]|nr:hypothetical protein [Candidatus Uhrbacteria bacterium]